MRPAEPVPGSDSTRHTTDLFRTQRSCSWTWLFYGPPRGAAAKLTGVTDVLQVQSNAGVFQIAQCGRRSEQGTQTIEQSGFLAPGKVLLIMLT